MSHIDEGRLHAWLDGALGPLTGPEGAAMAHHLATCDECRARLEQESAIRERARSVLASADRALPEAPPFADLVAQARSVGLDAEGEFGPQPVNAAPDSARRRTGRRISRVGLAWAASITVVVGAGLLGRELALQSGRDLPAGLDFGRESVQAPTDEREDLRENAPVAREATPSDSPARQKSELNAVVEAEEPTAGRGAEAQKLQVRERSDADLAEVAAPPAAPAVGAAQEEAKDEESGSRARFAARPPHIGLAIGHPALGCWRLESGQAEAGIPTRLRLTDERLPDEVEGGLRLEADPDPHTTGNDAPAWLPLSADSAWLSIPPRIFRLAPADDMLTGQVRDPTEPSAGDPSEVRYTRVECGTP